MSTIDAGRPFQSLIIIEKESLLSSDTPDENSFLQPSHIRFALILSKKDIFNHKGKAF